MPANIPDFSDDLKQAVQLRQRSQPETLKQAEVLLKQAIKAYPSAVLPLTDELVTVLLLQDREDDANNELRGLIQRFPNAGEETLCRFGKVYKRMADRQVKAQHHSAAASNLQESESYYARAYETSKGFYPRINELTVRFVRAGILLKCQKPDDSQQLLLQVRDQVRQMLADPLVWQARKPDDHIWIPASQGEARILLGEFEQAQQAYSEAKREASKQPEQAKFYFDCMRGQIRQLLIPAYEQLNLPFTGALANPEAYFQLA